MRALAGAVLLSAGCARDRAEGAAPAIAEPRLVELFEGVRADPEMGIVEFDGFVAIDCHHPETPDVYLEVICCTRDTREHEALVVTDVAPSLVHAALLAAGAEPGAPGAWREQDGSLRPVPPRGDRVRITLLTRGEGGIETEHDPASWVRAADSERTLRSAAPDAAWVFAGSRLRERGGRTVYDADGTGQLIGLHTFGSETLAWTRVESPDSWIDEPRWLARNEAVPAFGTPVRVRLSVERRPSP
ncbi:MAG TPA: YdjY domain-containing protein [Phycisphaerales bacterium]|nr:YdjY domain-containing protein [Phycisphaerales bacterium]